MPKTINAAMLEYERRLWLQGMRRVAGVDEAGRGPLAGPVVAAAVVFDPEFIEAEEKRLFLLLTDSKQLSVRQRQDFFILLTGSPMVQIGVGFAGVAEIDSINILRATHQAMIRAVLNLSPAAGHILVDGLPVPGLPCASTAIVKGDARSLSIAAASVIAKVTRDKWMEELGLAHPEYYFHKHKGYGTALHIRALLKHGPMVQHRRTFRPVRDIEDIRMRLSHAGEANHGHNKESGGLFPDTDASARKTRS